MSPAGGDGGGRGGLSARFAALSRRERLLFLGVLLAGLLGVWNLRMLVPLEQNGKLLERRRQELTRHLEELAAMEQAAQAQRVVSPSGGVGLGQALAALRRREAGAFAGVADPASAALGILEQVLQEQDGVRLVALTTRPPLVAFDGRQRKAWRQEEQARLRLAGVLPDHVSAPGGGSRSHLLARTAEPPDDPAAGGASEKPALPSLYLHAIHVTLLGSYHEIVNYLNRIERSGVPLYWEELEYRVVQYPLAEVKLRVFALGFDKSIYGLQ